MLISRKETNDVYVFPFSKTDTKFERNSIVIAIVIPVQLIIISRPDYYY